MTRLEAISDPVRLRIVRHLERHADASLQELATAAGVHPNTIRAHVAALESGGALTRGHLHAGGRGRPQVRYRLADDWTLPTTDFLGLAEVLAAVLVRRGATPGDMREIGLAWGRFLLGRPGGHDLEEQLPRALEQLGFNVRLEGKTLELSSCPCALVAPDLPELVCELAIAIADGVLAGAGSELRVSERVHDPEGRACSARLAVVRGNGRGRKRAKTLTRIRRRPGDHER
jgi:predicted ArsR family transcriptional regulator